MSTDAPEQLQGGSYEVIRARLLNQATALSEKASALNARRKAEFGGQELSVVGNDRVRTENNCVPRSIVSVGRHLLVGFNVFMGLKQERSVSDVFSLHASERLPDGGFDFSAVPFSEAGGFLQDRRFVKDFEELTRYYRDTKLVTLRKTEARLLAVFQTGATERDVKVFRFSLDAEGRATYVDNRGEQDLQPLASHDFSWVQAGRDRQVSGRHPHVNVLDEVFIETVGGDLTVKVENNTEDGQGIYREPVDEADQSLDDAEFHFAKVGVLILLKVLPFREKAYRYLIFNTRTQKVHRADAVGVSCVQLPEDQGVIFPGGYALQTGDFKLFDGDVTGFELESRLKSPNGEDVLYVFSEKKSGRSVLLPYNLVRKEVSNPIACHGYTLFSDGRLLTLKGGTEPARVHPLQVWQTPFIAAEVAAAQKPTNQTFLGKVGNAELVRGISDALTLERLAKADEPTRRTYEDLIAACTRITDTYYWLGHAEVQLLEVVKQLKSAAELIVDEFEKVLALQRRAADELQKAATAQAELVRRVTPDDLRSTEACMEALTALRQQRGALITLEELRFIDLQRLEALKKEAAEAFERASGFTVDFLSQPSALQPVLEQLDRALDAVGKAETTTALEPVHQSLEKVAAGLDVLGEVVGGLKVGDPTLRAKILDGISDVFGRLNRVRATAAARRKELLGRERRSEFGAQFKLLGQSIESALSQADSPQKCDEQLARLQVQLEELEGRFSELDEFASELVKKREELFEAFGAKKQSLLDERQRRAQNLFTAAERILASVGRRATTFTSDDQLNAYFAADPMLEKLRAVAKELLELGDSVRADELESKVKAAKQDALRSLRDKKDLFEGGANVIKLGEHRFNVNTQPLELAVLPRDGELWVTLAGTDFQHRLDHPTLQSAKDLWAQTLPSESADVSRAEFLAGQLWFDAEAHRHGRSLEQLKAAARDGTLGELTRAAAGERFDEGYERGLHDVDAALILSRLLELSASAGLLRFSAAARALATLFWADWEESAGRREALHRRAMSLRRLQQLFRGGAEAEGLVGELHAELAKFDAAQRLDAGTVRRAAEYLVLELGAEQPHFVVSSDAVALRDGLLAQLDVSGQRAALDEDMRVLAGSTAPRFALARSWVLAFVAQAPEGRRAGWSAVTDEAAALLAVDETRLPREVTAALAEVTLTGLLAPHPRVHEGKLPLRLDEVMSRLSAFIHERLPRYQAYRAALREVLDAERRRLRLDELKPQVLTSFVRNRLIDEVYLPLIGTNLAKQLGSAGDTRRTDRMGLLLLVSPPGYGKTTLMEYVASRLGLTFVKVNGPALGHEVVSLDPDDAPNATARLEVERINFAFELGNNVMLYLDDIQHTNPELLQKFISLCDGQRKVEGVWQGKTRTYDFRGKKFCVVMAGNPYTESGERFRIPDMLANRADTYNLGDILGGQQALFASSYLENSLTSNPVLAPLAVRPPTDVHKLIRIAQGESLPSSELEHGYSQVELQEIVSVLERLLTVQATLLKVNQAYIESASQDDRFRTEPPFKLQGSYRNMNKLTEKVVAAMTPDELQTLIDGHYRGESQTLTTAAEVNLLKLAELRGRQTAEQQARWLELKRGYQRAQSMGGKEDDPVVRVTGTLASLGAELSKISDAVGQGSAIGGKLDALTAAVSESNDAAVAEQLQQLQKTLVTLSQRAPAVAVAPPTDAGLSLVLQQLAESIQKAQDRAAAADLGPVLLQLSDSIRESGTRAPAADLGPVLQQVAQSMKAQTERAEKQGEVAPVLQQVSQTMQSITERQAPLADMGPMLQQLAQTMRAISERPAAPAVDLSPMLQQLAQTMRSIAERPALPPKPRRADVERQVKRLQDSLAPLAARAKQVLQSDANGHLEAVEVWHHISQALELITALAGPPRK